MKRIIFAMALLCASLSAYAQHSLQMDNGAGGIMILHAPPGLGTSNVTVPPGSGTLVLTTDVSLLPSQAGHAGEYLTTDGTTASWAPVLGGGSGSVTQFNFTNGGGFSGIVTNATTTPTLALTLDNGAVSYLQIQDITDNRLLGRSAGSVGSIQEITIGSGLTLVGGELSATGSGGTVTSVGGIAPLSSTGGNTPDISISQATTSTNGYLHATDWNTFNDKLSMVFVSAPITGAGTFASPLAMAKSDASTNGYLHATDWNTFNDKLSMVFVSAPITGAGTFGSPLAMAKSDASTNGYLHMNDWTTFNNKLSTVFVTGPITGNGTIGTPLAIAQASSTTDGYLSMGDWNTFNSKGSGTVTTVSVTTANGVSGSVANATTTPTITFTLGAITPSSVASIGTVTGTNLSGTNTGDQTITLTSDVTGSGTGSFATTIANNAVTNGKFRQSAGLSVVGNSTNATANVADISAANDGEVLRRSGTAVGFGTVATAGIANSAVTLAKIQNATANSKLLGSGAAGSGSPYTEITIGSGLSMTGTTLSATGSSTVYLTWGGNSRGGDWDNGTTDYSSLYGTQDPSNTQADHEIIIPVACTITAIYVNLNGTPGASNSYTFDVMNISAATNSGDVVISDAETADSNTGLSLAVSAGDRVVFRCVPNSSPSGREGSWGIRATVP